MIIRKCDRCGKDISVLSTNVYISAARVMRESEESRITKDSTRTMHLCTECEHRFDKLVIAFQLYKKRQIAKQPVDY